MLCCRFGVAVRIVGDDAHIVPMCVEVGRRADVGIRPYGGCVVGII